MLNRIFEQSRSPEPEEGMGATEYMYSDRHAYTIVKVISDKEIVVKQDNAKRTDKNGMSESQSYDYTPNTEAAPVILTKRKNGRWIRRGDPMRAGGFVLDVRDEYYDFSF